MFLANVSDLLVYKNIQTRLRGFSLPPIQQPIQ